jgi:hypothetical protein
MRVIYQKKENFPGECELFRANVDRSLRGKKGQQELRELRDALLALRKKRLIAGALTDTKGNVCAIGAYAKHKGMDPASFYLWKIDPLVLGESCGMPDLVAWRIVEMNDVDLAGINPNHRYDMMLGWVESKICRLGKIKAG